jgi:beta-glucanase (GH16 family)
MPPSSFFVRRLPTKSILISLSLAFVGPLHAVPPAGYSLVWEDNFTGTSLDLSKWNYRHTGVTKRDSTYVENAVSVNNGLLTITDYTSGGANYTGAIATDTTFLPTYGYFEAKIEFNGASGVDQDFWLMSLDDKGTGTAAANGTEMDIAENRATPDNNYYTDNAVHWNGYGPDEQHASHYFNSTQFGPPTGFHTYGLEWTPTSMTFFLDGQPIWDGGSGGVSQHPEYIILSSDVHNDTWTGLAPADGYGDLGTSTTTMEVAYVRAYQLVPEPSTAGLVASGLLAAATRRRRRPL